MYKSHRDLLGVVSAESEAQGSSNSDSACSNMDLYGFEDYEEHLPLYSEKRQSALFLLKTLTISKVSETALDNLIGDVSVLLNRKIEKLKGKLIDVLDKKGVQFDDDVNAVFNDHELTSSFDGLHSEHYRKKYFVDALNCF